MKKSILFSVIAMIALASCQQKEDFTLPVEGELMTFYASIMDDATKTTALDNGEKTKVLWAKNDAYAMSVRGGGFAKFTLDGEGGETTGTFSGTAVEGGGTQNIAYYPYAYGITISDGKLNNVVFPADQAYTENCIAAAPMVAVSENNTLKFQNVASLVKITLKGTATIKSVSLTGNNNEVIAGNAIVTYEGEGAPSLALANDADGKTITLNCGEGIALNNTEGVDFYFAVPVGNFTQGFTVVATDSDNKKMTKTTTNEVVLTASKVKIFPAFTYEANTTSVSSAKALNKAIEAAESGATITLAGDIESSDIITINKAITLNGNGKKLTSTAGRAINVSGAEANDVTIQNLTIECTGERGINIIQSATKVTIDNVTIDAHNYAVNIAGSAPDADVTIQNSDLTGLNVVNVGGVKAQVTVTNTKLTNDNTVNDDNQYAILCLNKDATGGSSIAATGCTFNRGNNTVNGRNDTADGTITIDETTTDVVETVAYIDYGTYYKPRATFEEIVEVAKAGNTITLIRDITVSEIITINKAITLDLNGKTLTENGQSSETDFRMTFNGNVTIKNGTIETTSRHPIVIGNADRITGAFEDVDIVGIRPGEIPNSVNGTVILIGDADVTFDSNCTINATGYTCAIEGSSNDAMTSSANITINGASITLENNSTYSHATVLGAGYGSTINVTGGTIDGSQAANAVLTYSTGGTINIAGGTVMGNLNKVEPSAGSAIVITGGTFTVDPSAYVKNGYEATKDEPNWVVSKEL